jgi:hypothetical protein
MHVREAKALLDNMSMFTLGRTILLVSVWARHVMSDANTLKEKIQVLILPTPISLHGNDFPIQQAFNKFLKVNEVLKNFRFVSKKVNPSKFAKIINKAHIVIVSSNRGWSRTPYIRENKVQGIIRHTKGFGIGQLMALPLLTHITNGLFI